jgi:hypothetical protein
MVVRGSLRGVNARYRKVVITFALMVPAACALAMLFPAPSAYASVSIAIPFDDLVRESVAAVLVTPESASVVWEEGRIITYTKSHIDTVVAGSVAGATEIWVRTRGGDIGQVGQAAEGEAVLTTGRPTLLFVRAPNAHAATPYVVTARAQGQFPVATDADGALRVYASDAVGLLMPKAATAGRAPLAPHPLASEVLHGHTLPDAKAAIARAWGPQHAP